MTYSTYPSIVAFKYAYGRVLVLRDALPNGYYYGPTCRALETLFGKCVKQIKPEKPLLVVGKPEISTLKTKWLYLELFDPADMLEEIRERVFEQVPAPMVDTLFAVDLRLTDDPESIPELRNAGKGLLL